MAIWDKTCCAAATKLKSGRLTGILWQFGIKFAARWPRKEGARLIEGHLHANLFGGTCNWPLKGGARLTEVAATAGETVMPIKPL